METSGISASTYRQPQSSADKKLKAVADQLEATFLSEMLKSAGVAETPSLFGGGAGEGQFASFLRDEYARELTAAGGLSLGEALFNSLKERQNDE
ncbi:rod-binding protein [Pseudooceanicola atlanticus]|uniref:Flagellar protein FlgJ N-terminal domain-containing protein n=1 Tax=Pseudooceanicola atlanticus TaxID=1461694 RepID=A0A0A0EFN3_9RHOB|nr:rod-binding protein [Pseudooceanicola atlanticus]KGM49771.1 hypothetical protein ATO9_07095 [Pseudooceanicola atlanticus]